MKREITYFKIKVGNPDMLKRVKKLSFVSFNEQDGTGVYRTMSIDTKEEMSDYLTEIGCEPISVSRLSLKPS